MRTSYSPTATLLTALGLSLIGCGDNFSSNTPPVDSKPPGDATSNTDDAPTDGPLVTTEWPEGGGTTIEYQLIYNGMDPANPIRQARVTAFYWKQLMTSIANRPHDYPFIPNPGCAPTGLATPDDDSDDKFPYGMGTGMPKQHEYLDTGEPIITGGDAPLLVPRGTMPKDEAGRPHDGPFYFVKKNAPGEAEMYMGPNDALYSLHLTGSDEWPEQFYKDAFYMPPAFEVITPAFGPVQIMADTPVEHRWTAGTPQNLPPGVEISYLTGFIVPGIGPTMVCLDDNPAGGQMTVPADMINYVRSVGQAGLMARAMIVHRVAELTDGTTSTMKRHDFVSIWCYVNPWSAAP